MGDTRNSNGVGHVYCWRNVQVAALLCVGLHDNSGWIIFFNLVTWTAINTF